MSNEAETKPTEASASTGEVSKFDMIKGTLEFAKEKIGNFIRVAPGEARKHLKIAPQEDENKEGFIPSPFSLWANVPKKSDYEVPTYENKHSGNQRVLVVCTEQRYLITANDTKFHTGNHPIETLVPMMHLEEAGFGLDICTPTGESAKIEMWAMPEEDEVVKAFYEKKKAEFEKPLSLSDVASKLDASSYIAVFIPGGHGAMLGLPENKDVAKVISWVHEKEKYLITICHGPAALLAAVEEGKDFVYKDYEIVAFPDTVDKFSPLIGYLPGKLQWYFGEKLTAAGVKIMNKTPNGYTHKDRKLITGDSPKAANAFGKLAAESLLQDS